MQIFHRSFNSIAKASIVGAVLLLVGVAVIATGIYQSSYATRATVPLTQPVPFSHKHHVNGLGIDCRYCHATVETSAYADIPPVETCMSCHSQIWTESPMLEPVRRSFQTGEPLEWVRVHDLPDFVYFDHSIHVKKGVGCVTCHGQVDQMQLTWQANTLYMEWCLNCHRQPEAYVRPRERVFDMEWQPDDQQTLGQRLVKEYDIRKLTDCSTCHR
ncbi:MAG TPA: cytochrome c3 family protein [Acidobacteriota bacterium]|nr:cytochrome c3 family protein [Acidobacteriota bacterium]